MFHVCTIGQKGIGGSLRNVRTAEGHLKMQRERNLNYSRRIRDVLQEESRTRTFGTILFPSAQSIERIRGKHKLRQSEKRRKAIWHNYDVSKKSRLRNFRHRRLLYNLRHRATLQILQSYAPLF